MGGTTRRTAGGLLHETEQTACAPPVTHCVDFSDHEEDRFFFNDTGHPSAKAWIFYDHGIDDFYHTKKG